MSRPSSRGGSSWRRCCARCPSGRASSGRRSTRRPSRPWSAPSGDARAPLAPRLPLHSRSPSTATAAPCMVPAWWAVTLPPALGPATPLPRAPQVRDVQKGTRTLQALCSEGKYHKGGPVGCGEADGWWQGSAVCTACWQAHRWLWSPMPSLPEPPAACSHGGDVTRARPEANRGAVCVQHQGVPDRCPHGEGGAEWRAWRCWSVMRVPAVLLRSKSSKALLPGRLYGAPDQRGMAHRMPCATMLGFVGQHPAPNLAPEPSVGSPNLCRGALGRRLLDG